MTDKNEMPDALAAFDVICERLDGYQTAKDIVRRALTTPSRVEAPETKEALEALDWLPICLNMSHEQWCDGAGWQDDFNIKIDTIRRALTAQQSVASLKADVHAKDEALRKANQRIRELVQKATDKNKKIAGLVKALQDIQKQIEIIVGDLKEHCIMHRIAQQALREWEGTK